MAWMLWSDEDVVMLKLLWPSPLSDKELARRLGRARGAMRNKAMHLGLPPRVLARVLDYDRVSEQYATKSTRDNQGGRPMAGKYDRGGRPMAGKYDREGGAAADVQDEILAAACKALDKAHDLLSFLIRYEGKVTPAYMERVRDWVEGEYDPGTRKPKRCRHNWAKCALTPDMYCTRCGVPRSVGCQ